MRFIELNHVIRDGLISYPGMPPVEISAYLTREQCGGAYGDEAAALLDQIKMVNISGTYIDAPYHKYENGYKIDAIPLEKLFDLRTFVVHLSQERSYFDVEDLESLENEDLEGAAVLLHSGHDKKFMTPAYEIDVPWLTPEGGRWLVERKVALVGIDTQLIDDFNDKSKGDLVHEIILSAQGVICEDMTGLEQLPDKGARLYVIPPRVEMASFPARVFAVLDDPPPEGASGH